MKNIVSQYKNTDPEFAKVIENFACDEVINNDDLDDRTRMMAVLSTLVGSQSTDAFKEMLGCALDSGVAGDSISWTGKSVSFSEVRQRRTDRARHRPSSRWTGDYEPDRPFGKR